MPRDLTSERQLAIEPDNLRGRALAQHCLTGPCHGGALPCPTSAACQRADDERRAARDRRAVPYVRAPWWRRLLWRFTR
jgi:hypothetical protein